MEAASSWIYSRKDNWSTKDGEWAIFCEKNKYIIEKFTDLTKAFCTANVSFHSTALLWKATWKLLRKNIPSAAAIPCLDQLGKNYLPKLLESHVKLFLRCFNSKTIWPFWKKDQNTWTIDFCQDVSHVQSNKNYVKLRMVVCFTYFVFMWLCVQKIHKFIF